MNMQNLDGAFDMVIVNETKRGDPGRETRSLPVSHACLFPKNLQQQTNKGQMPHTEQALGSSRLSSLGVIAVRMPSGHVTTDAFTDIPAGSLVYFLRR